MAKVNYTNTKLQTHEYIIQIDIVGVVYYIHYVGNTCNWILSLFNSNSGLSRSEQGV